MLFERDRKKRKESEFRTRESGEIYFEVFGKRV